VPAWETLVIGQVTPQFAGALFAAVALALADHLLLRQFLSRIDGYHRHHAHTPVRLQGRRGLMRRVCVS